MVDQDQTTEAETIEIDTRYAAERWRYICPKGHVDWKVSGPEFYCDSCAETYGDGFFDELTDRRSAESIPRERVRVTKTTVAAEYEEEYLDVEEKGAVPD